MPIVLHPGMTDHAILLAIAKTYADAGNWESFEKDTGAGVCEINPWIERDRGDYARNGLRFIEGRKR